MAWFVCKQHTAVCKRIHKFTAFQRNNFACLQHGSGNYFTLNDVTITPCIVDK